MNYGTKDRMPANTAMASLRGLQRIPVPARFAIWCLSLFAMASLLPEELFSPLNRHTAQVSAELSRLIGIDPILSGTTLALGHLSVDVVTECSPLFVWMIFFSFVASRPAPLRIKIAGLLLWIPLLHVANILRIAMIFAAGVKFPDLFDLAHVYLGQVLMVLLLVAACRSWLSSSDPEQARPDATAFTLRCIAWSTFPFLIWVLYNRDYVRLTDHLVQWLFMLSGTRLEFPYSHAIYFQTFNLVTISGILLAGRKEIDRKKVPAVLAAIMTIVSLHLLVRICNVLMTAFGYVSVANLSTAAGVTGQYLLPILFWMVIIRTRPQELQKISAVSTSLTH